MLYFFFAKYDDVDEDNKAEYNPVIVAIIVGLSGITVVTTIVAISCILRRRKFRFSTVATEGNFMFIVTNFMSLQIIDTYIDWFKIRIFRLDEEAGLSEEKRESKDAKLSVPSGNIQNQSYYW